MIGFLGQFMSAFINLWIAYTSDVSVTEPKAPDYILCHDYRDHTSPPDQYGLPQRLATHKIHIFNCSMVELFRIDEKFRWTYK